MSEGENLDYEMGPFIDYNMEPSPEQLKEIYDNGFKGVKLTPGKYEVYRASLSRFYKEYPKAKDLGVGKVSSPFKACLAVDEGFGATESQTTGDCVSHATRNAGMVDYCIDAMFGESEFLGRFATENIYGARGWAGQGADCSTLCEYVSQEGDGGFLVRKKYVSEDGRNSVDLSRYNGSIGHNWGRSGTPAWLNKIAASNKALRVFAIKTVDEARDAIAAGFGINVCSDYGFDSTRNSDGICEARGSWSHAMAWVGVDDSSEMVKKYGGPLFLIQNSWGEWNDGPKRNDQPDGSFYIRPKVAKAMIAAGGAYCIASVRGYNRELVYDMMHNIQELN